jgi:hypothetical protein
MNSLFDYAEFYLGVVSGALPPEPLDHSRSKIGPSCLEVACNVRQRKELFSGSYAEWSFLTVNVMNPLYVHI